MKANSIIFFAPFLAMSVACQAAPVASLSEAAPEPAAVETVEAAPVAEGEVQLASAATSGSSEEIQVICRSVKQTGTRFAKRECKTPEAWEEFDGYTTQNAKDSTDRLQRLNTGAATRAPGAE
jgi:hypothetical protein